MKNTFATFASIAIFFAATAASAACLEKAPQGVAKLIALATEADKQFFIDRGFAEVSCPASFNPTSASVSATCQKLDDYSPEAKTFFQQTYGVTTLEFCSAAQAYVAES